MSKLRCPECKKANTVEDWDLETLRVYGNDCLSIVNERDRSGSYFCCPSCKKQLIDGEDIKDINKMIKEAIELLTENGYIINTAINKS
jgi:predicted RNase H-like HicB family nuclease